MSISFDHTFFRFINQSLANPVLDVLCPILRDKYTWFPVYVIGSIWVLYKHRLQGLWMIAFAGLAILLTDQSSNLIKLLVHRVRPCHAEAGVRLLIDHCSDTYSFTSNHAANHYALSIFIALLFRRRWLTPILMFWAFSIAFSQVYVGIHYPFDVMAGAMLGGAIAYTVYRLYLRLTS